MPAKYSRTDRFSIPLFLVERDHRGYLGLMKLNAALSRTAGPLHLAVPPIIHATVGRVALSYASPRPSLGSPMNLTMNLGNIEHRTSNSQHPMELANPVRAQDAAAVSCSLSPGERVRVRGNDGSTAG